ncbi:sigma-54 dependent transcriptional regulator [Conchiformibius steedae]|uniref:sigma-54-dependent transcriptional regulator n=1 Tax=Conchiformibius steedae TaxID=153493 RepID=UPI0026F13A4F|nr:sigma-54 dependent transcriptional regulator [Conchiformibius steedae]
MRSTDILIVDDEIGIREVLQETLEDEGYSVALAENAEQARQLRNQTRPAMVLLDIWMPDSDGITLLKEWASNGQLTMPVVMMSGHGSIDTAVEATKIGALDFLEKPIPLQKLFSAVERALKTGETQSAAGASLERLGNSNVIKELGKQLERAARHNSPILLLGESGSPFEAVARFFHKNHTPWIEPVRPDHITDSPLELLQKSANGVLYLGDIAQYNKSVQQSIAFLLTKAERYHARVVCTCSQPLSELVSSPTQDNRLLNVLSSLVISLPPLRQQLDDIPFLVNQITSELAQAQKSTPVRFSADAVGRLCQYDWPGNLEQLKNVVKNLALNSEGSEVGQQAVHKMLGQFMQQNDGEMVNGFDFNLPLRELREELERRYFEYHIRRENQNMSRVAQKVGLERTHLYRKLKQLGISVTRRSAAARHGEHPESQ